MGEGTDPGAGKECPMEDEKIIAVPFSDPTYNAYHNISDLPAHLIEEMRHFFKVYGALQNKTVNVNKATGPDAAKQIIAEAITRYQQKYGDR